MHTHTCLCQSKACSYLNYVMWLVPSPLQSDWFPLPSDLIGPLSQTIWLASFLHTIRLVTFSYAIWLVPSPPQLASPPYPVDRQCVSVWRSWTDPCSCRLSEPTAICHLHPLLWDHSWNNTAPTALPPSNQVWRFTYCVWLLFHFCMPHDLQHVFIYTFMYRLKWSGPDLVLRTCIAACFITPFSCVYFAG